MNEKMYQFFEKQLKLDENWKITDIEQNNDSHKVMVNIVYVTDKYRCPKCRMAATIHDNRKRTVRHLDTCGYQTYFKVIYPRVICALCGTRAIIPPFATTSSRFTKAFERRVLELCQNSSIQKISKDMVLHWHTVARIIDLSFKRDRIKQRRQAKKGKIKRGHSYVPMLIDTNMGFMLNGRDMETVKGWFERQRLRNFSELRSITENTFIHDDLQYMKTLCKNIFNDYKEKSNELYKKQEIITGYNVIWSKSYLEYKPLFKKIKIYKKKPKTVPFFYGTKFDQNNDNKPYYCCCSIYDEKICKELFFI